MLFISSIFSSIKNALKGAYNALSRLVQRFPLGSFFGLIAILFILVLVANFINRTPTAATEAAATPRKVPIFHLGALPRLRFNAQVDKSGTITITAQAAGVVSSINTAAGRTAYAGQRLVSLASNYQGGNAASIQRQLASANYNQAVRNLPIQQASIEQRRKIAEQTAVNASSLREISRASLGETKNIIESSKNSLRSIDDLISTQEDHQDSAVNDMTLASLRQQRIGLLNGITSAEQSLRSTAYTSSEAQATAELSKLSKETTLKQLEIEARALSLNTEISQLNMRLAQVAESAMFPVAPFTGTVQKVHVKIGEPVSPGTPLVTFSGRNQTTTVEVKVAPEVASRLSQTEYSVLSWGNESVEVLPQSISSEPTTGNLFSVIFVVPTENGTSLSDGQYIDVDMPIGAAQTSTTTPFIPLDAVYQTENSSYIYIIKDGKAVTQEVTLGHVYDGYVEVLSGAEGSIDIILDRSIVAGNPVVS